MSIVAVVRAESERQQRALRAVPDRSGAAVQRARRVKTRQRVRPDHPRTYGDRLLSAVPENLHVMPAASYVQIQSEAATVARQYGGTAQRSPRSVSPVARKLRSAQLNAERSRLGAVDSGVKKWSTAHNATVSNAAAGVAAHRHSTQRQFASVEMAVPGLATHGVTTRVVQRPLLTAPMKFVLAVGLMVGVFGLMFSLGLSASLSLGIVG
ncbi:MAG: hypothetical protein MR006_06610 [Arcanobacterium sp.]|nr:hypothetical protein [Arcanobacterium sp.]MDY5589520.1 hypothetical protein [Arcanobacterium sp.]